MRVACAVICCAHTTCMDPETVAARIAECYAQQYHAVRYRNNRGLRTLCGRLLKCFRSQILIAQGCEDADMFEVIDTCAETE